MRALTMEEMPEMLESEEEMSNQQSTPQLNLNTVLTSVVGAFVIYACVTLMGQGRDLAVIQSEQKSAKEAISQMSSSFVPRMEMSAVIENIKSENASTRAMVLKVEADLHALKER